MKRHPAIFLLMAISLAATPAAWAHPGHEGHELTWDFDHLAAHPLATLGCFLAIGVVAWIGWRCLRPATGEQTGKAARLKR